MKKVFSLLLVVALCMSLCIPAWAVSSNVNGEPRMRNSDFSSTPPFESTASDYTSYMGARYGNVPTEAFVCRTATGLLGGLVTTAIGGFFGTQLSQAIAGVIGSTVIGSTGMSIQTLATQYAPNSQVVGYVMYTFAHPSPPPTVQYYQYTIVYYPSAVSSGQPLPAGGTFPITFYEYNWFS